MLLPIVQSVHSGDGQRYFDVEHPRGWHMRLPLDWTDRAPPLVPPRIGGREVHLSLPALLKLAGAVKVALEQRLESPAAPVSRTASKLTHAPTAAPKNRPSVADALRKSQTGVAGRLGDAAAQNASRRGDRRGGER
jgi:hypothetical protein